MERLAHRREDYEKAIEAFLRPRKRNKHVIGTLLVGSYATGLETPLSDIDVCMVLENGVRRWERGNVMVSDFLVEYAAYPIAYIKYLQERDLRERMRLRTRMLATGIILFDKNGVVRRLQKEARVLLKRKLPPQYTETTEIHKYLLWDQLNNLRDLRRQRARGFAYAYYAALQNLLNFYASYLRIEVPRPNRIHCFFSDAEFRARYGIRAFPDAMFSKLFERAMRWPSLPILTRLTARVHKRMGGFSINGWKLCGWVPGNASWRRRKRIEQRTEHRPR